MSEILAAQIVGIFAIMFLGIVIVVMWFTNANSKIESNKEIKKKQIEVIDRHFNDMVRIECPYCKTLYSSKINECPTCGANTKKIVFPNLPE
jgi:rubrerythrin